RAERAVDPAGFVVLAARRRAAAGPAARARRGSLPARAAPVAAGRGAEDGAVRTPAQALRAAPLRGVAAEPPDAPLQRTRTARHRRAAAPLADHRQRHRGLSHRGGHAGRRGHARAVVGHDGIQARPGAVLHRRGGRRHRLARRLQLPVGLGFWPRRGGSRMSGLAVVGGGPAGLMAAEVARMAGVEVDLFEAKGSVGRKFLIAGKGELNLTHSEPMPGFASRYREREGGIADWLRDFDADALRAWARGLGVDPYVGTSGRVFPTDLKAAPLLRGWVRRLRDQGVRFHVHHRWLGWDDDGALRLATPDGERRVRADAVVFALGGGSWPQLGSDG